MGWVYLGCALLLALLGCNAKTSSDAESNVDSSDTNGGTTTESSGTDASTSGGSTSNTLVDQLRDTTVSSVDVLLVIDNSLGMADKQNLLAFSLPRLFLRLSLPDCVVRDAGGSVAERQRPSPDGSCPQGSTPEFPPVDDIHVGVITSSLGGHGGEICSPALPAQFNPTQNDQAHLMPTVRPELSLPSFSGLGFLAWDPKIVTSEQLQSQLSQHLMAAGELGCGYEATLEAWYRFLIDPTPPQDFYNDGVFAYPVTDAAGNVAVDETLLAQRAQFLRPDSLVAIIMLTDENDCSVVDGGVGWLTTKLEGDNGAFNMPSASSACEADPNDPCCRSCGLNEAAPPAGCSSLLLDPGCTTRDPATDRLSLRCWDQKRRFGFDLLYPIERYVSGLSDRLVVDTHNCSGGDCPSVPNPLYEAADTPSLRDPSRVFLAGIVGVPWQDIASDASLADPGLLEYLTAVEMASKGRWSLIVGDASANIPPADPLMLASSDPRSGTQPITGQALAPETSSDPVANSINGHESINTDNSDLQYACIFPLEAPRDCSPASGAQSCDCAESDIERNRPLCNPPTTGPAGTTQYFAKAYPGTRLLETLRDFGDNSVVASICPKVSTGDLQAAVFGYNPAIDALVNRFGKVLGRRCLPRPLAPDPQTTQVSCSIVEVTLTENFCDPARGRAEVEPNLLAQVHEQLEQIQACGGPTGLDCDRYQACEITQLSGQALDDCLGLIDYPATGLPGFCYVDRDQGVGNELLLSDCPPDEQRKLRFVGDNTPASGSLQFMACAGSAGQ